MTLPRASSPAADVEVALRRPPLWSHGLSLWVQFAGIVALLCLWDLASRLRRGEPIREDTLGSFLMPIACLGVVGLSLVARLWVRTRPLLPIAFFADGVRLPVHPDGWRSARVPYDEVVSVLEVGLGRQLVVETPRRVFRLPARIFSAPTGAERVARELRRRILDAPGGGRRVEEIRRRRHEAAGRLARPAMVSQALAGLMMVMFAATWAKGSLAGAFDLLRWGAMSAPLVKDGQIFRLLAANFLHTDVWQAVVSVAFFTQLARLVEQLLGWPRLLVGVATGGVGVMLTQAAGGAVASVGASGVIFTLLGMYAWVSRRLRLALPIGMSQPARPWAFIVGVHLFLTLWWPLTDPTVLPVGFVLGLVVAQATLPRATSLPPPAPPAWRVAGGLAGVAILGALALGVHHARGHVDDEDLVVARRLLAEGPEALMARRTLARGWLDQAATGPERLRCARALAERDRLLDPHQPLVADTLARALARLNDLDGALAEARAAVDLSDSSMIFAMGLGRWVAKSLEARGPRAPSGVDARAARLHIVPDSGDVMLDAVPEGGPWQIYALVRYRERPLMLVMTSLPPGGALPHKVATVPSWQREQLARFELAVAWVAPLSGNQPPVSRPQEGIVPILAFREGA